MAMPKIIQSYKLPNGQTLTALRSDVLKIAIKAAETELSKKGTPAQSTERSRVRGE